MRSLFAVGACCLLLAGTGCKGKPETTVDEQREGLLKIVNEKRDLYRIAYERWNEKTKDREKENYSEQIAATEVLLKVGDELLVAIERFEAYAGPQPEYSKMLESLRNRSSLHDMLRGLRRMEEFQRHKPPKQ